MINANEANCMAQANAAVITEENRVKAEEFVEKVLAPLIEQKVAEGKFSLEKEFSYSELSGYNMVAIKRVVQSYGYVFDYITTRDMKHEFAIMSVSWA